MIIDHVGITVRDYDESKRFFCRALAPLGIELIMEVHGWAGWGRGDKPELWIAAAPGATAAAAAAAAAGRSPVHIAFLARSRDEVRAFHAAALEAGGTDNGPPGIREVYHPNYFGAFVLSPDGHNIEAVCHEPAPSDSSV